MYVSLTSVYFDCNKDSLTSAVMFRGKEEYTPFYHKYPSKAPNRTDVWYMLHGNQTIEPMKATQLCEHQKLMYKEMFGSRRVVSCVIDPDETNRWRQPNCMLGEAYGLLVTLSDNTQVQVLPCKECYFGHRKYISDEQRVCGVR